MKRIIAALLAACLTVGALSPTIAIAQPKTTWTHRILHDFYSVRRTLGNRAAGRDIIRRGVIKHGHARPATKSEKARFQRQLRALLHPPRLMYTSPIPPKQYPAGTSSAFHVAALPSCTWVKESGGSYTASNGQYWGKYQIALSHWNYGAVCYGLGKGPQGQEDCAVRVAESEGVNSHTWANC